MSDQPEPNLYLVKVGRAPGVIVGEDGAARARERHIEPEPLDQPGEIERARADGATDYVEGAWFPGDPLPEGDPLLRGTDPLGVREVPASIDPDA
jgi:hypothetical protein